MKKMVTCATCLCIGLNLLADDIKQPYLIQRDNEILVIVEMPKSTLSDPISNSFVYVNGEYIVSPYIVSVSNLAVCINGRVIWDYEPRVKKIEDYLGRVGTTPETVANVVDGHYQSLVRRLTRGGTFQYYWGGERSSGMDDGSGALKLIELAGKATKGDEQAKQTLIKEMRLENSLSHVHPDWIERLANNTNLETRATAILEEKRERERLERERREQQQ